MFKKMEVMGPEGSVNRIVILRGKKLTKMWVQASVPRFHAYKGRWVMLQRHMSVARKKKWSRHVSATRRR